MLPAFDSELDLHNRAQMVRYATRTLVVAAPEQQQEGDRLHHPQPDDAHWLPALLASRRAAIAHARAMHAEHTAKATALQQRVAGLMQAIRWHTPLDPTHQPVHQLSQDAFVAFTLEHNDLTDHIVRTKNQAATLKDSAQEPIDASLAAINAYLANRRQPPLPALSAQEHLDVLDICLRLMHDHHMYDYGWDDIDEARGMSAEEREAHFECMY